MNYYALIICEFILMKSVGIFTPFIHKFLTASVLIGYAFCRWHTTSVVVVALRMRNSHPSSTTHSGRIDANGG
jgi:hypothetical protein